MIIRLETVFGSLEPHRLPPFAGERKKVGRFGWGFYPINPGKGKEIATSRKDRDRFSLPALAFLNATNYWGY